MSNKVIISCAVTGSAHTPTMSDALPVTPEEIAHAVRFLVSPLSASITGEILDVNSGIHMD